MGSSPRFALLALLLLAVPAAVTALFLARNAARAVEPALQPGGPVAGRVAALDATPPGMSLAGVPLELVGVARDGSQRVLARASTDTNGSFTFEASPLDGHYAIRVVAGDWLTTSAPFSLARGPRRDLVVPLRAAARLELDFVGPGPAPRAGSYTLTGETGGSWFASTGGSPYERRGTFAGARLVLDGLPPSRVNLGLEFDGGTRVDLIVDLLPGRNHSTVEL